MTLRHPVVRDILREIDHSRHVAGSKECDDSLNLRTKVGYYQRWKNEMLYEREVKMAEEVLLHATDGNFEPEILKSDIPVMVDFWAPWCGPCHVIAPVIEELAKEYAGKVKVAKMNVEENPTTSSRYGIRGIPTVILFKDGQIFDQIVGAVPKSKVEDMIKKAL